MGESKIYQYSSGKINREVTIEVGLVYEVQPLSKQKNKKNRGRICTVLGFREWLSSCQQHATERARVKWHDTDRIGYVDSVDLIRYAGHPVKQKRVTI